MKNPTIWIKQKEFRECLDIACDTGFKKGQEFEKQEMLKEIEDIKADIENERNYILNSTRNFTPNDVLDVIDYISEILDKHISGKESDAISN